MQICACRFGTLTRLNYRLHFDEIRYKDITKVVLLETTIASISHSGKLKCSLAGRTIAKTYSKMQKQSDLQIWTNILNSATAV